MPKIKKLQIIKKDHGENDLLSPEPFFACEYECKCGKIIQYFDFEQPENLSKCFECLE